jgi:hypothetical protein
MPPQQQGASYRKGPAPTGPLRITSHCHHGGMPPQRGQRAVLTTPFTEAAGGSVVSQSGWFLSHGQCHRVEDAMAAYVNKLRDWSRLFYGRTPAPPPSFGLTADTQDELHALAAKLGIRRDPGTPVGPQQELVTRTKPRETIAQIPSAATTKPQYMPGQGRRRTRAARRSSQPTHSCRALVLDPVRRMRGSRELSAIILPHMTTANSHTPCDDSDLSMWAGSTLAAANGSVGETRLLHGTARQRQPYPCRAWECQRSRCPCPTPSECPAPSSAHWQTRVSAARGGLRVPHRSP